MKEVEMIVATAGGSWMPNLTIGERTKSGEGFNSMSEVINDTTTVPKRSRKRKGGRGMKNDVPSAVLHSSSKQKSRKQRYRKFKRKSKKRKTLDIKPPTVQGGCPSHDNGPLESMHIDSEQAKAPIPSPSSPTEIRLAALKALLLQAKGRDISNNPVPKSTAAKSRSGWLKADLLEDIARKRVASPELSVPAADDYWGILNYEKRSETINMESLYFSLCGV